MEKYEGKKGKLGPNGQHFINTTSKSVSILKEALLKILGEALLKGDIMD